MTPTDAFWQQLADRLEGAQGAAATVEVRKDYSGETYLSIPTAGTAEALEVEWDEQSGLLCFTARAWDRTGGVSAERELTCCLPLLDGAEWTARAALAFIDSTQPADC